jgi:hypothetical protein
VGGSGETLYARLTPMLLAGFFARTILDFDYKTKTSIYSRGLTTITP